jgi:hypothetical protein
MHVTRNVTFRSRRYWGRQEIPRILCKPKYIAVFRTACNWALFYARWSQSRSAHPGHLRSTVLVSICAQVYQLACPEWLDTRISDLFVCFFHLFILYSITLILLMPIPVVERSKARVCGRSLAGISGSNPAGNMADCLLSVLCVVR